MPANDSGLAAPSDSPSHAQAGFNGEGDEILDLAKTNL
jgi:hypothetical protein